MMYGIVFVTGVLWFRHTKVAYLPETAAGNLSYEYFKLVVNAHKFQKTAGTLSFRGFEKAQSFPKHFARSFMNQGSGRTCFRLQNYASIAACQLLSTYIEHKKCEGVAEVIVAPNTVEGFRMILQAMDLANLKPNIVCMRYPEIWRDHRDKNIPENLVSIINDCSLSNKAVVIVKGLDEWPGEY